MDHETDVETLELGVKSAKIASFVGLTQIAAMLIGGATIIVLARLLQPAEYGIYTLAYSTSIFFSAFGMSGIGHYLNKHIPVWIIRKRRNELKADLGTSFAALAAICLGATVVGVAFSGVVSEYAFHSTAYILLIDLALASIVSAQLMYLAYNALIGFKDGVGSALTYSLGTLAISSASIGLVLLGYGAYGAIGGVVLGTWIGTAIGIFFITRHSGMSLDIGNFGRRAKRILGFSLPVAASSMVATFMNSFSILLLGIFSTSVLIGSFGIAYRIGTLVVAALGFIGSVLVQMFASALESKKSASKIKEMYNYSIYFGTVIVAPVLAYFIVMSHAFVISVFPAYKSSLIYTPAISISLFLGIVWSYASSLLISMGKVKKVLRYSIITGVVQLVLLLILVPLFNAYGVIIAVYLAGSLIADYLYARYMRRELGIATELGGVYRVMAATFVFALLLIPITFVPISQTQQLIAAIIALVLVYPPLLGITKAMGARELRIIRVIGKGMPVIGGVVSAFAGYVSFFSR